MQHPQVAVRDALFHVGARDCPARQVGLRATGHERFTTFSGAAGGGFVVEDILVSKASFEVCDGAVHLYQVRALP